MFPNNWTKISFQMFASKILLFFCFLEVSKFYWKFVCIQISIGSTVPQRFFLKPLTLPLYHQISQSTSKHQVQRFCWQKKVMLLSRSRPWHWYSGVSIICNVFYIVIISKEFFVFFLQCFAQALTSHCYLWITLQSLNFEVMKILVFWCQDLLCYNNGIHLGGL